MEISEGGGRSSHEHRPARPIEPDDFPDLTHPAFETGPKPDQPNIFQRPIIHPAFETGAKPNQPNIFQRPMIHPAFETGAKPDKADVFPGLTRPAPDIGAEHDKPEDQMAEGVEQVEPGGEEPWRAVETVEPDESTTDVDEAGRAAEATQLVEPPAEDAESTGEVDESMADGRQPVELAAENSKQAIETVEPDESTTDVGDELDLIGLSSELVIESAEPREPTTARVERVEPAADGTEQATDTVESVEPTPDVVEPAEPVVEGTELVEPSAEGTESVRADEVRESITNTDLIEPHFRSERPELASPSTTVRDRGMSPPRADTEVQARDRRPPSAGRSANTSRPAAAQEPVESPPRVETEEPARSRTPCTVEWEAETPLSFTARARFGSMPASHRVRELEAEFGPVEVSRAQTATSPGREAAQRLKNRNDLEFFKPHIEALIKDTVESRRQEAAQEIWTRAVTIVVPSVTLDNQRQALHEGLLQWLNHEIQPARRPGEASKKQPWIVGWFFDTLREVVIALAKEALIELLLPGVHLIIPPTGIVEAVLAACTMLEIAEAA
jgi:hypothetical protein